MAIFFVFRSAAETEAAHDLLELSRSLPPLPPPSIVIGPQNVIEHSTNDIQEMTIYQPSEQPIYQVNTIDFNSATTFYHPQPQHPHIHSNTGPPSGIIYESAALVHTVKMLFIIPRLNNKCKNLTRYQIDLLDLKEIKTHGLCF
jgi:hypothetical protein